MKEKDLYIDFKAQQAVYFVEKDDQSYGPILSGSHISSQYLDEFYEKKQKLEARLRKEVIDNIISPIMYYMTLQDLTPPDLASRAKVAIGKLKKHLTADGFKRAKISQLQEYSRVFNVPVANFFQLLQLKNEDREKVIVKQLATSNNLFSLTNIELK